MNLDTEQNCPTYSELQPPTVNATTGLAEGVGCVYPAAVKTLADELTAGSLDLEGLRAGHGSGRTGELTAPAADTRAARAQPRAPTLSGTSQQPTLRARTTGAHSRHERGARYHHSLRRGHLPPARTGHAGDPNHTPAPGDPYLTYRNPFVYFDSLLSEGACASNDVDLSQLQASLATPADTPSLSWIVPSACNDGSSRSLHHGRARRARTRRRFLKEVVPQILATSAYARKA